jgi:4-hydroxybenzoate polyprenyltransferase
VNGLVRLCDGFFLARPTLLFPVWAFFLAGYRILPGESPDLRMSGFSPAGAVMAVTLVMAGAYVVNQIFDEETDRINGKLFLIPRGIVSHGAAWAEAAVLAVLGVGLGFVLDLGLGCVLSTLFVLSAGMYNFPPVRWKDRPVMGLLTNMVGGGLILWSGWAAQRGWSACPVGMAGYMLAAGAVFFATTLPDMEGDRRTGKRTFAVRYGMKATMVWALVLEAAAAASAVLVGDWMLAVPGLLVLPFFLMAALKPGIARASWAVHSLVIGLCGSVTVRFPMFGAVVAAVFFASRWYYKSRFDFSYPRVKATL